MYKRILKPQVLRRITTRLRNQQSNTSDTPNFKSKAAQASAGFAGLVKGVMGGMLGIGGSMVAIPMLRFFCGLTQHQAHGTSIVAVLASGMYCCCFGEWYCDLVV